MNKKGKCFVLGLGLLGWLLLMDHFWFSWSLPSSKRLSSWIHMLSQIATTHAAWFWGSWSLFIIAGIVLLISQESLRSSASRSLPWSVVGSVSMFTPEKTIHKAWSRHQILHYCLSALTLLCWLSALGLLWVWMGGWT